MAIAVVAVVRPKSCVVCGRRNLDGAARCELHKVGGRRLQPCLVCGRPSQGRYCQLHNPELDEAERNARNPYRQHYKDPAYARARQHRFERAHGKCEACGVYLQPAQWQCDHIVPLSRGGSNDITNLQVLCIPCHRRKTRRERHADK